ncbi:MULTISPECIES: hypothetical protein [Actinoalloteichus]|uniref:Lipoprotein n=1 Tax=Actinoalloteichus caeruleus DSM 43889 TaxID=1120930 RepID=A0ABT1JKF4_ACTCY|nr:hypothetical protein [Actinoalloteichus caeruleus]MCP2332779.1 hypothetical protein [Actinoalloteichus caeruleus DSM 43889]
MSVTRGLSVLVLSALLIVSCGTEEDVVPSEGPAPTAGTTTPDEVEPTPHPTMTTEPPGTSAPTGNGSVDPVPPGAGAPTAGCDTHPVPRVEVPRTHEFQVVSENGCDQVVLAFRTAVPEVIGHQLDAEPPLWGGSAEPVPGMAADGRTQFLHVYVAAPVTGTLGPRGYELPWVRGVVVNDASHGTVELTIALPAGPGTDPVDYEVLVEDNQVVARF